MVAYIKFHNNACKTLLLIGLRSATRMLCAMWLYAATVEWAFRCDPDELVGAG